MAIGEQAVRIEKEARAGRRALMVVGILTVVYFAFVLLYRLDVTPVPFIDEGSFLKVAKNFALHGVYADFSSEGDRYTGAIVSTGPTLILPIALLFKLFGSSLVLGRLVSVAYGLGMLAAFFAVGRSLFNIRMAYAATLLAFWVAPLITFQDMTRTVLGEVPGLFFIFAGLWLWLRPGTRGIPALVGVGVLMGLAAVTKNQYAIFVLPSLLLAWIADLVWYRRRGIPYFVIPGIVAGIIFGAWTYFVVYLDGAGVRNVAADLASLRAISGTTFFHLESDLTIANIAYVAYSMGPLLIPGILVGLLLAVPRDDEGQRWGIVWLFFVTSVAIFVLSIGWDRYAFPCLFFGALFAARILYALTDGFQPDWAALRKAIMRGGQITQPLIGTLVALGIAFGLVVLPAYRQLREVTASGSDDVYHVTQYLNETVPSGVLVESMEEELGVLTNLKVHYPELIYYTADYWLTHKYDFRKTSDPDYVVVGTYGKKFGMYQPAQLTGYTLVKTFGIYDVYQKGASAVTSSAPTDGVFR